MLQSIKDLERAALEIRKDLLKLCSMQTIHIGGDLSATDMMTVLWQYQMRYDPKNVKDESRDRFVLSKGHASAVTSLNQAAIGCFDKQLVFDEYATDGGRFSMHSCNLVNPYVEVSTGSLGHGMPIACGMAAGLRIKGNMTSRVYTVMGDGEQAEGSIWEAAMNAVHYKLGNLVALLDYNGLEADGPLDDCTSLGNIAKKYAVFGWNVLEIDGNDVQQIVSAFQMLPPPDTSIPSIIVGHTTKGKGVPFMEDNYLWHAGRITHEQFVACTRNLEEEYYQKWGSR